MTEREKSTVLVVEDQAINRQILRHMLSLEYEVVEAENGAEALRVLAREPGIAAVLLDIVMPVMDGYTFLERLRETPYAALPVIAVTGEKDENAEQRALDLGAWDFVSKPYRPTTLLTRLKNVIVRSQFYLVNQMRHAYEHDPITDLYNRTAFFAETRRLLDRNPQTKFALVRFDIDHFQAYNSYWGEEEGDRLLRFVADCLREVARRRPLCVYGRINADAFCLCMPFEEQVIRGSADKAAAALARYNPEYRLVPSFGVYVIDDPTEKIQKMYELATMAAGECKGSFLSYLAFYRPEMGEKAIRDQWVVNEMQKALDGGQFEAYLQPKYNLSTRQPYGAEALIRWRHPERGLLSPGLFIPVFEQNGFIGKVDYYMWEQVCVLLRGWLDAGLDPGPVSVNVSRVNLYNPNLVELLCELVRRHNVPPWLLNLELTESAYMDNPEVMSATVRALHEAGFRILMDDFGSGYSSLNTLKDIRVDVLKIDMKFLSGDSDALRSRCILASMIRMAGWLGMPVITEGVETAAQAEFLRSVGCNYVQGYYFARPMPAAEYEKLIRETRQSPAEQHAEHLPEIREALWAARPDNELLFNGFDLPAAICEYDLGAIRVLRRNAVFLQAFGPEFRLDAEADGGGSSLPPAPRQLVADAFAEAAETGQPLARGLDLTVAGGTRRVIMTVKYWGSNESARILFVQFRLADGRREPV